MSRQEYIISHAQLLKFLGAAAASGKQLYAPQRIGQSVSFAPVSDMGAIVFDHVQTAGSPKELLFPKHETLVSFEYTHGQVRTFDHAETKKRERVLFGSRPCDAAALKRLAEFFSRDIPDVFVAQRQEAMTVISMSCTKSDADCFCNSAGSGPGDTAGSDILLTPIENGRYFAECLSEKGSALILSQKDMFESSAPIEKQKYLANVEQTFSHEELSKKLSGAFGHEFWNSASLSCLGCGACAFVCPVCSCFDIQDEGSDKKGSRVRCWDSCGFPLFTLHTSGHNPRHNQSERWRQRIMHKFLYQPQLSASPGCVGCGRCSRACPADMNLKEQLQDIVQQISTVP
jgi:sulfhydrogenase subunit beta (sulfur reductase)